MFVEVRKYHKFQDSSFVLILHATVLPRGASSLGNRLSAAAAGGRRRHTARQPITGLK